MIPRDTTYCQATYRTLPAGALTTFGHRRVIRPEQLADALERLDPRERELLALSLRRRVPDEALARVYDVGPHEIARRRAAAIEHLANALGAQRGEDLGAVLKALLDEATWSAAEVGGEPAVAEPPEASAPEPAASAPAAHAAVEEPHHAERQAANGTPATAPASASSPRAPAPPRTPVLPVSSEPVLEMLAAREGVGGPAAGGTAKRKRGPARRSVVAVVLIGFVAALIGGAAALVGLSEWGEVEGGSAQSLDDGTRNFVPQLGGPLEAPFPSEPEQLTDCYSTAFVRGDSTLYREPGGKVRIRVKGKTEWGSDRVFGVVRRRGDWLAVQAPELENGELAWLNTERARIDCVRWSLHADLSRRRLYVRRDGETVRSFVIAVGRRQNPTPTGRFSVTDKLRVTDKGSPYGCCVLAVTGHQERLPPSWPGGDRLAVHATRELSSLGKPASLGCLRVTSTQARWLITTIPLGAPLFVRA